ncbi:UTP20 (YBL004W) [Zygosaccharomyces parabailii]|nr:UTP20 (YBL004W) [Zygosaccharomyces parabailii]CDH10326.1 related to U3 small nucleolar RNA-associated protein 20 [Zygosaccharomyces bailii ISA1307]
MAKQRGTPKATNRFRYASFKDKIDDLKIEPARNLGIRAHDYVDTSHFLASFEHWKEINLSASFTGFAEEIEGIVQTLPQILFHQDKISDLLLHYIDKHEPLSVQPLLDLLAQFCHDLGPDFLKFYDKAIRCMVRLLEIAVTFESSDVFEWVFTSLAYIFKYLSRYLTENLVPTFELLFPLLSHSKPYLSRFSAEAMSFLIRKSSSKKLVSFVSYAFNKLEQSPESNLYDGLLTLFTESLITTQNSLYSKSKAILQILVEQALGGNSEIAANFYSDLWIDIAHHASSDNLAPIYENTWSMLQQRITSDNVEELARITSAMVFAESGKKISDWFQVIKVTKMIISLEDRSRLFPQTVAFLFMVLFRNCDIKNLTHFHKTMFEHYLHEYPGSFIQFFKSSINFCPERVFSFSGNKYLQQYINKHWKSEGERTALLFLQSDEDSEVGKLLHVSTPKEFSKSVLGSFSRYHQNISEDALFDIGWGSIVLSKGTERNAAILTSLLEDILGMPSSTPDFQNDIFGYLLDVLGSENLEGSFELLKKILQQLKRYQNSLIFVKSLDKFLNQLEQTKELMSYLTVHQEYILILSDNLMLPDKELRYASLKLIGALFQAQGKLVPQLINECKIIEEVPLTLQCARDINVRIRNMGESFMRSVPNEILNSIFLKFMFGLLTLRFSPVWEGVYEVLSNVYGKNQELVWNLIMKFLNGPDAHYSLAYRTEEVMLEDEKLCSWDVKAIRLHEALTSFFHVWTNYSSPNATILQTMKEKRANLDYPGQIRNQTLKFMLMVPQLVERHSRDIVPYLFNQDESSEIFGMTDLIEKDPYSAATWTEADRNMLLKVIGKFRNMKSIYKWQAVHERLMVLLGSRSTEVQKLAFEALLGYNSSVLTKYKDNLRNLLDDALFKDELIRLVSKGESRIIEDNDEQELMPYIIRIFFGRAQTPGTSGIKKGRKHAVISMLPNLGDPYIVEFLKLGTSKFNCDHFFENGYQIQESEGDIITLRRMLGFVNIVNSSLQVLGSAFPTAMATTIRPLLYTISMSYYVTSKEIKEPHVAKIGANLRQQSLKCMNNIFQNMSDSPTLLAFLADICEIVILPRLEKFEDENLQQPSSILKIMECWSTTEELYPFLYYHGCASPFAMMRVLSNENAKESVLGVILETANNIISKPVEVEEYTDLVTVMASNCLHVLPTLYKRLTDPAIVSISVDLLLNLVYAGYLQDNETKKCLVQSLTLIIREKFRGINKKDIGKILHVTASLMKEYDCPWEDVKYLYEAICSLYAVYAERELREALNGVINSFGVKFPRLQKVAEFVCDLNSYSPTRMQEYDFPRILSSWKQFHEHQCKEFSNDQWLPVLFTCLFYINDEDELAIRTNASHTLCKFIDCMNEKPSMDDAAALIKTLKVIVLPNLRMALRKAKESIQAEYLSVLSYIVTTGKYFTDLNDMRVLLYDGDEEANFFTNVVHIQLHRRLRAVKRVREHAPELSESSISLYLIPIIERYVFSQEEKFRNIGNEALVTIGSLANFVSWSQYKALLRRYIFVLKSKPELLKESVSLIIKVSVALKNSLLHSRGGLNTSLSIRKFPGNLEDPERFVVDEIYPKLSVVLRIRDNETAVARIPISEALVNFVFGLSEERTVSLLPGILTSLCQILRSRSEELRDAVRKTLAEISKVLGAEYLPFILKELVSALRRGSQVHVLSFTVHHVLKTLESELKSSDLDNSSGMITNVIMEDIFGFAGEEKESDNYHTTMKEVKVNRSYDTAEMLTSNISLTFFSTVLGPVKALLLERINLKSQNKLNELLRRYALGLNHNAHASSVEVLALCHELFEQSENVVNVRAAKPSITEHEEFFLINLNAKKTKVHSGTSLFNATLQKFSLDLLRTVLSRHRQLLGVKYLQGFMPFLKLSLASDNEDLLISGLRVLLMMVKLEFPDESEGMFLNCARKVLNIIKDSPSTSSEVCQVGLKFLSATIRQKDIKLKDSALSYVLGRILPDLNEPNKQGLAFSFLKALVYRHVQLPELYDVIDTVRQIMVTNHSKEIRDVSRSVYYQFLMEYDQSKGRLEKQFKFMIDNLQYPSQEGRQSVMELVNLIVNKANSMLLSKLSSSFFVALANVFFNDDAPRCREMASLLLTNLLQKLDSESLKPIEKYIIAWLKQVQEPTFLNLGLRVYKVYMSTLGLGKNSTLDELAISRMRSIIFDTDVGSEQPWDLIYSSLSVFLAYTDMTEDVFACSMKIIWDKIIGCLLYPHPWIRQSAARIVDILVNNFDRFEAPFTELELQNIVSRIMRQLGAPSLPEDLATISVKTLMKIAIRWKQGNVAYIPKESDQGREVKYSNSLEYMIVRAGAIIRSEDNPADSVMSKKSCIRLLGLLIQVLDENQLVNESENIILPLFKYLEQGTGERHNEEQDMLSMAAQECLQILESKISVSDFTKAYANVKQVVLSRRQERKAKRAVLAVTAPDIAAHKKLRKHTRSRQKRKHEKDENGFYQRKNKKKRV